MAPFFIHAPTNRGKQICKLDEPSPAIGTGRPIPAQPTKEPIPLNEQTIRHTFHLPIKMEPNLAQKLLNSDNDTELPEQATLEITLTEEQALRAMGHHEHPAEIIRFSLPPAYPNPENQCACVSIDDLYDEALPEFALEYSRLTNGYYRPKPLSQIPLETLLALQQLALDDIWVTHGKSKNITLSAVKEAKLDLDLMLEMVISA